MLSRAIMRMLDALGRSADDPTRHLIAAMRPDVWKQWLADQMRAALADTSEQRERHAVRYDLFARETIALHVKDNKRVKPQRRAGKAA